MYRTPVVPDGYSDLLDKSIQQHDSDGRYDDPLLKRYGLNHCPQACGAIAKMPIQVVHGVPLSGPGEALFRNPPRPLLRPTLPQARG